MKTPSEPCRPLRVAVLVTLYWSETAGGHVKTWERLADAAASVPDLDLTIFFLGESDRVIERHSRARFCLLRPRFGTDRLRFLASGAGHTDLAGFHPGLAAALADVDLILTTDHFAFARTGRRVARERGIALMHSIHTDVEALARTYAPGIVARLVGARLGGWLERTIGLGDRLARAEGRKLQKHVRACRHVFVSRAEDAEWVAAAVPGMPVSYLRRGLNLALFHPDKRDRAGLEDRHGIGQDRILALFAGRADGSKRLMLAAEAVARLAGAIPALDLVVAGVGADLDRAKRLLGDRMWGLGLVSQADLATVMASCDLFVFPSESECLGNVVLEARASGLPVVLSGRRGGTGWLVKVSGVDGVVVSSDDPDAWAAAIARLLERDPKAIGRAARTVMEAEAPTWGRVLEEDLLRIWEGGSGASGPGGGRGSAPHFPGFHGHTRVCPLQDEAPSL